jgi:LCP family protein required for cell wall assembly
VPSVPSPHVAALLSFLFPGAGQIYARQVGRGLLWAIPMALFILGVLYVLAGGADLIDLIGDPQTAAALLILNLAFFFYHLAAMFDAYGIAQRERRMEGFNTPASAAIALAALVVITLVVHGVPEVMGVAGNDALSRLLPGRGSAVIPVESFPPLPTAPPNTGAVATPDGTANPEPSAIPSDPAGSPGTPQQTFPPFDPNWGAAADGRLNVLLVGADSGPGRTSVRTDTMILVSVEINTGKAALFGFPRNMLNVPLASESVGAYPGGTFPELLNALWRRAAESPEKFPGSDGIDGQACSRQFDCVRAWRALAGSIQQMAGVQIDGVIGVDLGGFVKLVDAVGGIWIDVPTRLVDDRYHWSDGTKAQIDIKPGCQPFEGEMALAYARSRHQDSDYQRMRRQQYVLSAVRRQFDPIAMLPRVFDLLDIAQDNMFMTFDRQEIGHLANVAARVDADRLYQVRFTPNQVAKLGGIDQIRGRVRNIFSEPEPKPTPKPSGRPASCPP